MKRHFKPNANEDGAAIVELVVVVPILIVLVAGILDLSLLIKSNMATDAAATALARRCMDDPSLASDNQQLCAYLKLIEPGLENATVKISKESEQKQPYVYSVYPDESENRVTRTSYNSYVPFTVSIDWQKNYYTLIGRGISYACGDNGELRVHSAQTGRLDTTSGATW